MFHRLKRADHTAELFALQRVGHGLIQHIPRRAQSVGREYNARYVYHTGTDLRIAAAGEIIRVAIIKNQLTNFTGFVDGSQRLAFKSRRVRFNQIQGAVRIRHQVKIGLEVQHEQRSAVEPGSIVCDFCFEPGVYRFGYGGPGDHTAVGQRGQPF